MLTPKQRGCYIWMMPNVYLDMEKLVSYFVCYSFLENDPLLGDKNKMKLPFFKFLSLIS